MATNYIIWSGGCDSTFLLHQWASVACSGYPLYAVSFDHWAMNKIKMASERRAQKAILRKLNNPFIKHIIMKTTNEGARMDPHGAGLGQAALWFGMIAPFVRENSQLLFGYIREDDFWHEGEHIRQVLTGLKGLSAADVEFRYPLEYTTKEEVVRGLQKEGLFDLCWTCESPKKVGVPCEECKPCRKLRATLLLMADIAKRAKVLYQPVKSRRQGR